MLKERNSIETSVHLGLFEGRLREAKESLAHLHNITSNYDLRLEIISMNQQINFLMEDRAMRFAKLRIDKAVEMKEDLRCILIALGLYRRKLETQALPYLGRVCQSINFARDLLQEVINELTASSEVEEIKDAVEQKAVDTVTIQ